MKTIKLTQEQLKSLITYGKVQVDEVILTALYSSKSGKSIIVEMLEPLQKLEPINDSIEMTSVNFIKPSKGRKVDKQENGGL